MHETEANSIILRHVCAISGAAGGSPCSRAGDPRAPEAIAAFPLSPGSSTRGRLASRPLDRAHKNPSRAREPGYPAYFSRLSHPLSALALVCGVIQFPFRRQETRSPPQPNRSLQSLRPTDATRFS